MSLLMQALRKAERAKQGVQLTEAHDEGELQLAPLETDVQKAAAGSEERPVGGPAFSLEPLEPPSSPSADRIDANDDADIPVVPATEAMHDPVPPQARPGVRHNPAASARASAEARLASDMPHGPRSPGGPGAASTSRTGMPRDGAGATVTGAGWPAGAPQPARSAYGAGGAARANSSASRQRLGVLGGLLLLIVLAFAFLYWRGVSGPGPGAALPPVPMPGPGAVATAPSAAPDGVIPGLAASQPATPVPATVSTQVAGTPATAPATAAAADSVPQAAATPAGAAGRASRGAAPATRPPTRVVMPTPEALAAIPDPAMREEAMRDAAERAARAARDTDIAPATSAVHGADMAAPRPVPSQPAAAAVHTVDTGDVRIVRNNATPQVSPALQNAWSAYNAGDLTAARQQYDAALLQDPNNRDALLGSAAVAIRERNGQQAAASYVRLLELDPNDPEALAGLVALRPGDSEQAESRLKAILQRTPDSGPVQFALGNLYARQGRWPDAQQAYFRAFTAAPGNPDYAFNLAVGLDRLNQGKLAQSYYQRALALSQGTPAGFDPNAVRKRLQELGATAP
jgi:tetratricopeptide (TPR) repeat protein